MSLIELKNITFAYSEEEPEIFKNFSYSVEKGTCVMVRGENGSGKTTLFRILNGLSFPQEGSYRLEDVEITDKYLRNNRNSKLFHKKIGYLFQNPDVMLFNAMVYDEVAFGPRQMGLSDEEVDRRVKDCMDLFKISQLSGKAPYHLSGGQKKRVAFASVMALNPEILVLDEPLAGLDRKTGEWLIGFLKDLKAAKKTLIIATHNKDFEEALADVVLDLDSF